MYTLELTGKNLWAHKRRMAGTLLAVVLGVAFLSGTLLLGDTLRANFDRLYAQAYSGTDVVVRGATKIGDDARQNTRSGISGALVANVRGAPGVADAQPYVEGNGQLLTTKGKRIGGNGPPTRAASWISDTSLNPYRLAAGRVPRADDEVVVNRGAMKKGGLHLGDTTTLLTPEPLRVHIVGVSTFGDVDGFGPSTFTGMTLHAAQEHLTNRPDEVTEIRVKAASGVSADALAERISAALPATTQTITGSELAAENIDQINASFLGFVRNALLAFSIIAILVAAFSIYNTFSILAAQRGRETALQRALGATRRQVIGGGLVEAVSIGVLGSAVGLLAGAGVAAGLKAMFDGFGFSLPAGGLVFQSSSAIIAVVAGVLATVAAGVLPAVRASRVAPLAALRDVAVEPAAVSRRRMLVGALFGGAGIVAVIVAAAGSAGAGFAILGSALTLIGAVTLGPVAARPAARLIGAPAAATRGVAASLARDNAMRSPRRTAATASALIVGVSVVALFTVVGASLKASVTAEVGKSLTSDFVVGPTGFGGRSGSGSLSPKLAAAIAATPGVRDAVQLAGGSARLGGSAHDLTIVDPRRLDAVLRLDPVVGSLAAIDDEGVAVSKAVAKSHHWSVGTALPVVYPDGSSAVLHVAAIYSNTDIAGDYVVAASLWKPHAGQQLVRQVLVDAKPGADLNTVRASLEDAVRPYGLTSVDDREQFKRDSAAGINTILGIVYVMLTLAILIALMGIANTLSLSIYERTRELGLLRSVGQTRRQTRSMIRWESVIIAVFGTLGGVVLGTFLAWALVSSSTSTALAVFSVPPVQLVVFVVVGAVAGVLAAIRPARQAARMELLRAIGAE